MRTWGEAVTVKMKSSTSPKLKDKGVTCLFARCAEDHDRDCYRMWDPLRHYVYVTRDVVWLKRIHFTQNNATCYLVVPVIAAGESAKPNNEAVTNNINNGEENTNGGANQKKKN